MSNILKKASLITIIIIGFFLLYINRVSSKYFLELLNEQANQAGGYSIKSDDFTFSLLSLTASAKNLTLNDKDGQKLIFKNAKLFANIKNIYKKEIIFNKLILKNGETAGLLQDSATYKFINHLITPSEKKALIKIKLNNLEIKNIKIIDKKEKLSAKNFSFYLKNYKNLTSYKIKAENLYFKNTLINQLETNFKRDESGILEFNNLNLKNNELEIESKGVINKDIYDFNSKVNSKALNKNFNINNIVSVNKDDINIKSISKDESFNLNSDFNLAYDKVIINNFKLDFKDGEITKKNSNELNLNIKSFKYQDIKLKAFKGSLLLEDINKLVLNGDFKKITKQDLSLERGKAKLKYFNKRFSGNLKSINNNTYNLDLDSNKKLTVLTNKFPIQNLPLLITANGEIDLNKNLNGEVNLNNILIKNQKFSGKLKLNNNQIKVNLKDDFDNNKIFINYNQKDKQNSIQIESNNFKLSEYYEDKNCINSKFKINYEFDKEISDGSGFIILDKLNIFCKENQLRLANNQKIAIKNGKVLINDLSLFNKYSNIFLNGSIDQNIINIKSNGNLDLSSLISYSTDIEHLTGNSKFNIELKKEKNKDLIFLGKVKIEDSKLKLNNGNIYLNKINGDINFNLEEIIVKNLNGNINDGKFTINGDYPLKYDQNKKIDIKIVNTNYNAISDTLLNTNLNLILKQNKSKEPTLFGDVNINSAEIKKVINLNSILNYLTEYIFRLKKTNKLKEDKNNDNNFKLNLDLNINSPGSIYVTTNLLSSELKSYLQIKGTSQNPVISGYLKTINGWIGLNDRNFLIRDGQINFIPSEERIGIEMLAETKISDRQGNIYNITAEAIGDLDNPNVTFYSDGNLEEKEILQLLTTGSELNQNFSGNNIDSSLGKTYLLTKPGDNFFKKLLSEITSLDKLIIEPKYNSVTGLVEPALVAEKNITQELSLNAENFLSNNFSGSKFKGEYKISPRLILSGLFDSQITQEKSSVGTDLTYLVYESYFPLRIKLSGNSKISNNKLQRILKINRYSEIKKENVKGIKSKLKKYLNENGYHNPKINIKSEENYGYLSRLEIDIRIDKILKIKKINISSDKDLNYAFTNKYLNKNLNKKNQVKIINDIKKYLIKNKFFNNSINIKQDSEILNISIETNDKYIFKFNGNNFFSDNEILTKIGIYDNLNLGNNYKKVLSKKINSLYNDKGFFEVQTSIKETNSEESKNKVIIINIIENSILYINKFNFTGLNQEDEQTFFNEFIKNHQNHKKLLKTNIKIKSQEINNLLSTFRTTLKDIGFIDSEINYKINKISKTKANIDFNFVLEESIIFNNLKVKNIPIGLKLIKQPEILSITKINKLVDKYKNSLKNYGFLKSKIYTELNDENIEIVIEPGIPTTINSVEIRNNKEISKEFILKQLELKEGEHLNFDLLGNTRRNLIKTGLFSSINIFAKDGEFDSTQEDIIIETREKPLNNLEVGGGINSELGTHVFLEANNKSLFKDGRNLSFRIDSYYDTAISDISQGIASVRYFIPKLFKSNYQLSNNLRYQKLRLPTLEFNLDRTTFDTILFNNNTKNLSSSFSYTFLNENLENVSPGSIIGKFDDGNVKLGLLNANINYDKRDNPLRPEAGYQFNFDYTLASKYLGSDADYFISSNRFSYIHKVNEKITFANNLKLTSAWTFDDSDFIPISQRLYLGGRNSVRGFRENSLGPVSADIERIGGDLSFNSNSEIRFDIYKNLKFVSFLDTGLLKLKDVDIYQGDKLRLSTGLGLRYITPIGPIGIDVGFPLDPEEYESSSRIHFNVGSEF